ncbi:MAG TPA: LPS export ABC transporter periplasmic protein LptC [Archangium sp.]|uniref:LPS export ABC transporter periplasmic protein LptC n=1 Tax=Archangium sp. TaxID=1872627 RepID=UPI002E3154C9|nr:LPS export ABC transporter periplasmic protein LptC [Archangium sp.]HEX5747482.1 LPS export ABC transporter periplasmic protein LptC [Archangium sp.]
MRRPLLSLLALLAACTQKQATEDASAPPAVVMHGVRLRSYDGSTLSMTGEATLATWDRTGELTATQATVHVPDKGANGTAPKGKQAGGTTVRAKLMEGNPGARQLVASGDVEVRTASGLVAHTPRATYDGSQQVARGTEGVEVTGPNGRMRADAFSLSFPTGQFDFEGSVRANVQGATR